MAFELETSLPSLCGGYGLRRMCLPTCSTRAKHVEQLPLLERWLDKQKSRSGPFSSGASCRTFVTHPPASETKPNGSYKPAQDMLFPSPETARPSWGQTCNLNFISAETRTPRTLLLCVPLASQGGSPGHPPSGLT